jgi:hypothetical protein
MIGLRNHVRVPKGLVDSTSRFIWTPRDAELKKAQIGNCEGLHQPARIDTDNPEQDLRHIIQRRRQHRRFGLAPHLIRRLKGVPKS